MTWFARWAVLALALLSQSVSALSFSCQFLSGNSQHPFGLEAGDWNKDGRLDLVVSYAGTGTLTPFLNEGNRKYGAEPDIAAGEVSRGIAVGDINGDGWQDLGVANATSSDVAIALGDGKGGFKAATKLLAGMSPFHASFVDLDGDGKLDLVVVNETNLPWEGTPGTVSVFYGNGTGEFGKPLTLTAGDHPSSFAIADLDGQHGPDIAVTNWKSDTVSIFLNGGDRTFRHAGEVPIGGGPSYSVYAADFDKDGALDLAVTEIQGSSVRVLYGDGKGNFPRSARLAVGNGVRCVVGADLDGDGIVDLVTANTASADLSILMGRPKGEFAPAVNIKVGPQPRMVMARDLDGDGKIDLAATIAGSDVTALLFQTNGQEQPCPPAPKSKGN